MLTHLAEQPSCQLNNHLILIKIFNVKELPSELSVLKFENDNPEYTSKMEKENSDG
jgi:hypothetical protein